MSPEVHVRGVGLKAISDVRSNTTPDDAPISYGALVGVASHMGSVPSSASHPMIASPVGRRK